MSVQSVPDGLEGIRCRLKPLAVPYPKHAVALRGQEAVPNLVTSARLLQRGERLLSTAQTRGCDRAVGPPPGQPEAPRARVDSVRLQAREHHRSQRRHQDLRARRPRQFAVPAQLRALRVVVGRGEELPYTTDAAAVRGRRLFSFGRSSYTGLHVMQNGYYFAGE